MAGHIAGCVTGTRSTHDRQVDLSVSSDRPRDRLGRPIDPGDPRAYPSVPERYDISGPEAWLVAKKYLDDGLPFHAHEVFEQRWKCCPAHERDTWQALAQWGAALTQQARGNVTGQQRIATRARERFENAIDQGVVPQYVEVSRVLTSLSQLA